MAGGEATGADGDRRGSTVSGGNGSAGLAVAAVVLGSRVTRGEAQLEAIEAVLGAAGSVLSYPPATPLWAEVVGWIPTDLVLDWVGRLGMWLIRAGLEGS